MLESDSDSDDSGPVYGGRSDDEGAAVLYLYVRCGSMCLLQSNVWAGTRKMFTTE